MPDSDLNEQWLACKLDRGMFSDEVAVTYPPNSDFRKSVFVPANFVKPSESGQIGVVRVQVIVRDGKRYAVLPSSQRDIVRVEEADLHK